MRDPLEPGTLIAFDQFIAEVVEDKGGPTLTVRCTDGDVRETPEEDIHVEEWAWELEGTVCRVIGKVDPAINLRLLALETFVQAIATDDRLGKMWATGPEGPSYQEQARKILGW